MNMIAPENKDNAPVPVTPANLLEIAVNQNADLDKLEKLMDLQERWEKAEAKRAYTEAMTAFKSDPPEIDKDRFIRFGQTEYSHASLHNVTTTINKSLSEHGLSASWQTHQDNGSVTVSCTITHTKGHSESTSLSAPPDTSGSKNSIQAIGSTISYLERYTLLALTGLSTKDMDNDGAAATEYISLDQQTEIGDLIKEAKADQKKFLLFAGADSVETIQVSAYKRCVSMLKEKKARLDDRRQ